jgi:hypothetical protein
MGLPISEMASVRGSQSTIRFISAAVGVVAGGNGLFGIVEAKIDS